MRRMPRLAIKGPVSVWPELIGQTVLLSIWYALFRKHNVMIVSLVFAAWNVAEAFRTDDFRWWHYSVDEISGPCFDANAAKAFDVDARLDGWPRAACRGSCHWPIVCLCFEASLPLESSVRSQRGNAQRSKKHISIPRQRHPNTKLPLRARWTS